MAQLVIASRLSDGLVVFLKGTAASGAAEWVLELDAAETADDDARAAELLKLGEADAVANQVIIDPYLIDVEEQDGQLRPTKFREIIRCFGPTIRFDAGKQTEPREA